MCMMVYLACDMELPEIKWVKDASLFYVECLDQTSNEYKIFNDLSGRSIVYCVGSYQGCGCGFTYGIEEPIQSLLGDDWDKLKPKVQESMLEDEGKGIKSVEAFFTYLRTNVSQDDTVDLYSCWAGDEKKDYVIHGEIDLNEYQLGDSFSFEEQQHILLYRSKAEYSSCTLSALLGHNFTFQTRVKVNPHLHTTSDSNILNVP